MSKFNNQKKKLYFILGTSTEVGKTYFTTEFIKKNIAQTFAIKPVQTGVKSMHESDVGEILKAMDLDVSEENTSRVNYYNFVAATSPNIAARKEGKECNFDKIVEFCKGIINSCEKEYLLIETAGGVMSPISDDRHNLHLLQEIGDTEVVLVVDIYIGSISHFLTALEALENVGVKKVLVYLNKAGHNQFDYYEIDEFIDGVRPFVKGKEIEYLEI